MTDAFQCERCDAFIHGSGYQMRVGEYCGTTGFTTQYDFEFTGELCYDCREQLYDTVAACLEVEVNDDE